MTIGLILAVLALIVSAIVWALGANSANPHLAGRGKLGVLVALGAAVICGASVGLGTSCGTSARRSETWACATRFVMALMPEGEHTVSSNDDW